MAGLVSLWWFTCECSRLDNFLNLKKEWGLTWEKHFCAGGLRSARRAAPRLMVAAWTGDGLDAPNEAAF